MQACVKRHGSGGRRLQRDEAVEFLKLYAREHALLGGNQNIDPRVCSCAAGSASALHTHDRQCSYALPVRMQHHHEHVLTMLFINQHKGHVVCPCGADQMIDPALTERPTPVPCPRCSESFCSCCKRKPFHHSLPCNRVDGVVAGYLEWRNERRHTVLQHLQRLDARFKAEKKQRDERVQQELESMKQMEGVLCCPHCNHPCGEVGELKCGKFICGRLETDSAASTIAGGCAREFKVEEARRYKAELPPSLRETLRPSVAKWTTKDGQVLRCQCCKEGIEGPLLQCIGCNRLNVCIRCEAKGHDHVRTSSERPCHNQSHYFEIHMNPEPGSVQPLASASSSTAAGGAAALLPVERDEQTAHVFRDDGGTTLLLLRATESRDEKEMVVPRVGVPACGQQHCAFAVFVCGCGGSCVTPPSGCC